jgi:hypothetical protein
MFLDREITPDLAKELERQKIVTAHSLGEVLINVKNRTRDDIDTTVLTAASDLDDMLE